MPPAPPENPARRLLTPALACLFLGLAPFLPEPHVVGKLRWVLGGAHGMSPGDWFDFAMHGAPWLWLGVELLRWSRSAGPAPRPGGPTGGPAGGPTGGPAGGPGQ